MNWFALGAVVLLSAGIAEALPLDSDSRTDLALLTVAVSQAIDGDLNKPKDGTGILGHLATSLESFQDAVRNLQDGDLSDNAKCTNASKEDERGLAEAFRSVRDGVKLKVGQFNSETAFNTYQLRLVFLTVRGLLAVETNINEAEALGANADKVTEARSRGNKAAVALFTKGDAAKAADEGQRAFDLISGEANVAPACLVGRL